MKSVSTFFFSRIVGNKVYTESGETIGKIKDLAVEMSDVRPKIVAISVKTDYGVKTLDFSKFIINKNKGQYILSCLEISEYPVDNDKTFFIGKYVLDKQIIDMDGRKLERVNDLRFAVVSNGTYLVAVDAGFEGFLRRLGVAKPVKFILKPLGLNIPSHYILWDDVEAVDFGHYGIRLSKDFSNLSKLHPSDLADIIEEMDVNTQMAVFASLDDEKAADVLEELETEAQISLIESLSIEKAADLLEKMPADEAADILEELHEEKAEELLNEMEDEASEEIRELMEYDDNTVGSVMTTDYIYFKETNTVSDVLAVMRQLKPEPDTIYYLYIVSNSGKLIATVSLRDIVVNDPDTILGKIMNKNIVSVLDTDDIESLSEIISKYNLLAVPVIDETDELMGMVLINDIVYSLLKARRKRL